MQRPSKFEIMRANRAWAGYASRKATMNERIDCAEFDALRERMKERAIEPPPPPADPRTSSLDLLEDSLCGQTRPRMGLLSRIFGRG